MREEAWLGEDEEERSGGRRSERASAGVGGRLEKGAARRGGREVGEEMISCRNEDGDGERMRGWQRQEGLGREQEAWRRDKERRGGQLNSGSRAIGGAPRFNAERWNESRFRHSSPNPAVRRVDLSGRLMSTKRSR